MAMVFPSTRSSSSSPFAFPFISPSPSPPLPPLPIHASRILTCTALPTILVRRFTSLPRQHLRHSLFASTPRALTDAEKPVAGDIDVDEWVKEAREYRLQHLENQALLVLKKTLDASRNPAFPCALIAGDVVILDLLNRLGVLSNGRVKIIFIDTFHLFPETYAFLETLEKRYMFKALRFHAADVENKEDYMKKYGTDLFLRDIDEYDRICKVEPFNRSLESLEVDAMINGRRRDHGAERAHLEVLEGGSRLKVQPLAYWEFRDVWEYLAKYGIPHHPLHDQGYPSIGDIQTTLPVPKEHWFEYGGERSGRFQGLKNKDGTLKTECGIHGGGSE